MKIELKEIYTKSNLISLLRMFLAIPLWIVLDNYEDATYRYIAFGICSFAAFTDMLDGYLARKFNEVTEFGKIIDPLADKVAMAAVVIKLFLVGAIPSLYFWVIILRDLFIFLGGLYVSKKIGRVLPSNKLGKATVLNIGFVILLILIGVPDTNSFFQVFYYSSIVLIFASLAGYVLRAVEFIKREKK